MPGNLTLAMKFAESAADWALFRKLSERRVTVAAQLPKRNSVPQRVCSQVLHRQRAACLSTLSTSPAPNIETQHAP